MPVSKRPAIVDFWMARILVSCSGRQMARLYLCGVIGWSRGRRDTANDEGQRDNIDWKHNYLRGVS